MSCNASIRKVMYFTSVPCVSEVAIHSFLPPPDRDHIGAALRFDLCLASSHKAVHLADHAPVDDVTGDVTKQGTR